MPIKYEYDPNLNIVHSRAHGELYIFEIANYFKEIKRDSDIRIGFVEVVHFEGVEKFLFSEDEAEHIALLYNDLVEKKNISATIITCKRNIHLRMARMFKLLQENNYPDKYCFIARNEEEADKFIKIAIS